MAESNQSQNNKQAGPEKPKTLTIRMKPGCGRMLIGRKYKLLDGSIVDKRPRHQDEVVDSIEEWLEQGKIATLPVSALAAYLDENGKPTRIIDGYPMVRVPGDAVQADPYGNPVPPVHDSFHAGSVKFDEKNELVSSHRDCPFEIVLEPRSSAAA
jgi:hypothetical protein